MRTSKKAKYEVLNSKNEILFSGNVLREIIDTTILNTIEYLEDEKSLLYKLEKNFFSYYDVLATIYKHSSYFIWENMIYIEGVHNNSNFLEVSKFIKFKKNTWTLTDSRMKLNLIKNNFISYRSIESHENKKTKH